MERMRSGDGVGSWVAKCILDEVVVMTLNLEVANTEIMRPQCQGFAKALQRCFTFRQNKV